MRAATTEWVVVLDDDHVVDTTWYVDLLDDLRSVSRGVAGVAARVDRSAPEDAPLATDVAYRRLVALSLGGYQARFPRAACTAEVELAHRVANAGWVISSGRRSSATAAPRDGRGISDTQAGSPEAETFAADIEG